MTSSEETTLVKKTLPRQVMSLAKKAAGSGDFLVSLATDIKRDGSFAGSDYLLVNAREALFIYNGAKPRLERVAVAKVKEASIETGLSSARLVLRGKRGGFIKRPLIFSNNLLKQFGEAAKVIQLLAEKEKDIKIGEEEQVRCPKCNRLLPERGGVCAACVSRIGVFRRLTGYLKPYRGSVALLMIMFVVESLTQSAGPLLMKILFDSVFVPKELAGTMRSVSACFERISGGEPWPMLVVIVLAMLGAHLLYFIARGAHSWISAGMGANLIADIRRDVFSHVARLPMSYFNQRQIGSITSRVTSDSQTLHEFLVEGLPYLAINALKLTLTIALLLYLNWKLTLLILIPAPILLIGGGVFWKMMRHLFHKWWQKWAKFSGDLHESFYAVKLVKAFNREGKESEKLDKDNMSLTRQTIFTDRRWITYALFIEFLMTSGIFIMLFYGGGQILKGNMSLGTLIAFQGYLFILYEPLRWFNQINQWMTRAFTGAERVFEVIDAKDEAGQEKKTLRLPRMKGDVRFEKVHFGYEAGKEVLRNITLNIKPGEMVGLVGKTGVGKSTIINLICRFYRANRGHIFIDGVDINELNLTDLRSQIGMVLQEPILFDGTIAENIAYGCDNASFEDVVFVARKAHMHEDIMKKPEAYDYLVGEHGKRLSTGEKQRVSIARALLHNPRLLILDEPTSSLDAETELKVQKGLRNLVKGRTTIAIAHRLTTLRYANRLIILKDGRVTEMGTHKELMRKHKGTYRHLVKIQEDMSKQMGVAL